MKKRVLFVLSGMLLTTLSFSQATDITLVNPSFELPNDSVKITCAAGWAGKVNGKADTIPYNKLYSYGWKIDSCNDMGREDPKKFGGSDATAGQAYDGWHVMYSHNRGGHIYQVVEKVTAGTQYSLTGYSWYSYSDSKDSSYSGVYISLFNGTDTTKRTIVAGDSLLWDITLGNPPEWDAIDTKYTTKSADAGKTLCIEFGCWAKPTSSYTYYYHDAFALTKIAATGVDEIANSNIVKVFPNPSNNGIFNLKNNLSGGKIVVYDVAGKQIENLKAQGNDILNLSNCSKGIYILKVQSGGENQFQKLVVR
jgi:hypothetical protein